VVLLLVIFGPILLGRITKDPKAPALSTVAFRTFPVTAAANGSLENAGLANENFGASGQVSAIYVSIGSKVSVGQLLAKLNDSQQLAKLNAAQAAYNSALAQLAQAEAGGSSAQILSAKTAVADALVQLVTAKQAETATSLTASEAGSVLAVNGAVGNTVSAGGQGTTGPTVGAPVANGFVVIGNPSIFVMWAAFSQTEEVQLAVGQPATVTVSALPGLPFPAKVTLVQTSATQVTGVPEFLAEVTLTRTDPRLRNGQSATVDVTVATASNVLSVPTAALFTGSNAATQVDVWSQGQAYATTVSTGLTGNQYTQITSGLQQGEQVVISPAGAGLSSTAAPSPT
jgi:membrane fusion protein, macrolide-specific efflux system